MNEHDRFQPRLSVQLPLRVGIGRAPRLLAHCAVLAWLACAAVPSLAAAPLSSAGPILAQLAAEAKDPSLSQDRRLEALEVLARWRTAEIRTPLQELLADPAPEIRAVAAKGLGWPGNSASVPALKERVLDRAESPAVRAAAAHALVEIGDAAIGPTLVALSRDADPKIREDALRGLIIDGPLKSQTDRQALAVLAVEDEALGLPFRAEAIRTLTSMKDPATVPVLIRVLDTGPRLKIAIPPPNATQNQNLQARYQQIRDIRAWAARGLGELQDRSALPSLVTATEDTDDFFLRYLAAGALASWRAREALPAFLRLLDDPWPDTRRIAVQAVAFVGDQSHVDVVAMRLRDGAVPVRLSACETLAALGGPAAAQRLEAAVQDEGHPEVRQGCEAARTQLKP